MGNRFKINNSWLNAQINHLGFLITRKKLRKKVFNKSMWWMSMENDLYWQTVQFLRFL